MDSRYPPPPFFATMEVPDDRFKRPLMVAFLIDYPSSGGVFCSDIRQEVVEIATYYYWLVCEDEDGKPYLVYGGATENEARQKGLDMLGGVDFRIKRLPTSNLRQASSFLKGSRLEKYHNLKKASKRIGHTKSIRRLKRRTSSNW